MREGNRNIPDLVCDAIYDEPALFIGESRDVAADFADVELAALCGWECRLEFKIQMFGLEFSLREKGLNVFVRQFCEMFLIVEDAVWVYKG